MAKQSQALRQGSRDRAARLITARPAQAVSHSSPRSTNAVVSRKFDLVPPTLRHELVSVAAYFRAEARGFAPGYELEDWLAAEQDIDETIRRRYAL
jgi:hypothetical protein